MKYTISLNENRDFRRLYRSPNTAVNTFVAVYFRKNKEKTNRLGITVSTKVGNAVTRNKIKRKIREIYRLNEDNIKKNIDIVIVSRKAAATASYHDIEKAMLKAFKKLGITN